MPPFKTMPYGNEIVYNWIISEYGHVAIYLIGAVATAIPIAIVMIYDVGYLPAGLLLSVIVTIIAAVICVILGMGLIGLKILATVVLIWLCRIVVNHLAS